MTTHTTTPHGRPRIGWTAALGALVLLGAGMSSSCNDHMVLPFLGPDWGVGRTVSTDVAREVDMDILWVVDNSGSMCQEQKALRENFDAFITTLDIALLDFHIAVTTTHAPGKDSSYRQEPVAIEGHIQSTPQPIPGFEAECIGTYDAGERVFTDFAPTRDALAVAVACMAEPDARLLEVTDAQLNCAHPDSTTPGCAEATGAVDRDGDGVFSLGDVFPLASEYRALPRVLRAQDYSTGDRIDVERLRADFACMSMVGTRGYGVEKGLQAAVAAVSPELTGLTSESPSADIDAPNHGFLRKDSAFTLIFVTDENDCSHDGDIDESPTQTCGPSICDYENAADLRGEDSDLTGIPTLAGRLRNNLAESKGRDVQESEILVASIHGLWNPYEGATPVCEDFEPNDLPKASPACDTELGQAFSGDRYDRFMRQFPNYYPNAVTGGDEEKRLDFENFQEFGEICTGDFSASLRAIGEFIGDAPGACITDRVYPCEATSECPAPLFGDAEPVCRTDLGVEGFCDTGIILRLLQSDDGRPIEENAYCIPESINAMRTERPSCVVDPSRYDWVPCSANGGAITFEWVGASTGEVTRELAGYELEVVYNARFGG
jgi:hypothetical protein